MRIRVNIGVCTTLFLLAACGRSDGGEPAESPTVLVSVASDAVPALRELAPLFERETGVRLSINAGSSGQLAQQIEQGAPVDVFLSANTAFVDDLERADLLVPGTRAPYARGRLVLWAREGLPVPLTEIGDFARPEIRRVAIANPDHAPYGMAAREAIEAAGVWDAVQPKLVLAENVLQAFQYVEAGNVDAALVARSLVPAESGRQRLVPQALHRPLDQALAVIRGTHREEPARAFTRFMTGPTAREILRRYGFEVPEEGER